MRFCSVSPARAPWKSLEVFPLFPHLKEQMPSWERASYPNTRRRGGTETPQASPAAVAVPGGAGGWGRVRAPGLEGCALAWAPPSHPLSG